MPLDATGFAPSRVLTPDEERDLAVLKAARHRIRHWWLWWKGGSMRAWPLLLGGTCAQIAVHKSEPDSVTWCSVIDRLIEQIPDGHRRPIGHFLYWASLAEYNDAWATKHADVLRLFDRAIAELEPRE